MLHRGVGFLQEDRLGDLQLQLCRGDPGVHAGAVQHLAETVVHHLPGGDIHRHRQRPSGGGQAGGVVGGAADRQAAEAHGHAVLLGQRDEHAGGNHPVEGGFPARQQLGTDHLAAGVELGLQDEIQLLVVDRRAQLGEQGDALQGVGGQPRVVNLAAVLAGVLGGVHGGVGVAQDGFRVAAVLGGEGDADAAGDTDAVAADLHVLAELVEQALGQLQGLLAVGADPLQGDELVAAPTRQQAVVGQQRAEARGDDAQQLVAGLVAERVVDLLEAVQVDEQHRQLPVGVDLAQLQAELLLQAAAVG